MAGETQPKETIFDTIGYINRRNEACKFRQKFGVHRLAWTAALFPIPEPKVESHRTLNVKPHIKKEDGSMIDTLRIYQKKQGFPNISKESLFVNLYLELALKMEDQDIAELIGISLAYLDYWKRKTGIKKYDIIEVFRRNIDL